MKTMEYAKVVYEKVEEFAEKVRVVLNEEFNKFFDLLWEDGSWSASDKESEYTLGRLLLCAQYNV